MKRIFLIGLIGLTILIPCVAQQAQATEGSATRYESRDTVYYASHASFPFGTQVVVTNLENGPNYGKKTIVQIGGRIPQDSKWLIDICTPAANALGMNRTGFTNVRLEEVPKAAKRKATRKFMQTGPASAQMPGTEYTAAHPSIPLGTSVRITNKANGKQAIATVTNRMAADGVRIIDLSRPLAQNLGLAGSAVIMLETVDKNTGK
jgi:rare lipoprotein A (peptidoglycan hydrolase)